MVGITTEIMRLLTARSLTSEMTEGADAYYLRLAPAGLPAAIQYLAGQHAVTLLDLWAARAEGGLHLYYAFAERTVAPVLILELPLPGRQATSIAAHYPAATYFERAVRDGFGVEFAGAYDTRRLFLHEAYPAGFHPLLTPGPVEPGPLRGVKPEEAYKFKEIEGEGVYQIPVGPVHAGIIEPGHFRFSVIGETIFNLEIRHGYKHRGLEKLAEGMTAAEGVQVAETVSGDESAANATAYALALERLAGTPAPPRAWQLRTILLEMERIYAHLGDLAGMTLDVAYPVGAAPFFVLREEVLRWNAELTGSRFLKGIIVPGGLRRDIAQEKLHELHEYTSEFARRCEEAVQAVLASSWVIDRFETAGVVKPELLRPLHLTGPIARAAGALGDTRRDHPYGCYPALKLEVKTREGSDVLARFQLKADEIKESLRLAHAAIHQAERGDAWRPCAPEEGRALALVEAARGENLHWVELREGRLARYHIRTASFCNWYAIEHAVLGNIVPDFPLINKSLNLSYAGNDL